MTTLEKIAVFTCVAGFFLHLVTVALASWRCRQAGGVEQQTWGIATSLPPVAILRPVRGVDPHDEMTLHSGFALNYPDFELIFCCADATDPAVALIASLIAEHPQVQARLLVGADHSTANPKLNNIIKGWQATGQPWVIMADCNVLMPADYIQRLFNAWQTDTGLVCSPPIGSLPQGLWAEVECAFLNTYQARWQYAADSIGLGFAQGKSMLWPRAALDRAGGIHALGAEIAEDAAATKIVRRQGLRVRLADRPFEQPLGVKSWSQLWSRQVRWSRLRRATFVPYFAPEILTCSLIPIGAGMYAAGAVGFAPTTATIVLLSVWYGSEALLARLAGWHLTNLSPAAWLLRDILIPFVWVAAWTGNSFTWRGNDMHATRRAMHDLDPPALPLKL